MAGNKAKPTVLKVVEGNRGRRPLPAHEAKPPPAEYLEAPSYLNTEGIKEWDRIIKTMVNVGLMTNIDLGALAAYCQSYGVWVQAELELREQGLIEPHHAYIIETDKGNWIQNPLLGVANKAKADMVRYAIEFGMTPSARSRVTAYPPEKGVDPLQEFFGT